MQDLANGVVESRNANIIGNSDSRFLQRLVDAGSGLIRTDKKRRRFFAAGQQRLYREVSEFAIFRADFTEAWLQIRLLHCLTISSRATCEPGKSLIPDVPDVAMTLPHKIPRNFSRAANIIREYTIVLFRSPLAH